MSKCLEDASNRGELRIEKADELQTVSKAKGECIYLYIYIL